MIFLKGNITKKKKKPCVVGPDIKSKKGYPRANIIFFKIQSGWILFFEKTIQMICHQVFP